MIYEVNETQYEVVYDILSFSLACMMATTLFLWFRLPSIHEKYKTAVLISGMVTFIAAYHYFRIFNSWTEAYKYDPANLGEKDPTGAYKVTAPVPTSQPFNDAYRYMDWLLTVPLLLMEIVLVMKLDSNTAFRKNVQLGVSSALMIVLGYPGEMVLEADELWKRWIFWAIAMLPFLYIVYELTVGLSGALAEEKEDHIKHKIWYAQRVTIVSWLTYPVVFIIPMMGASGSKAIVGIQVGYCFSDIISKCGVGLLIYNITLAKSRMAQGQRFGEKAAAGYENKSEGAAQDEMTPLLRA